MILFRPIDPRQYAALRIGFGVLIFLSVLDLYPEAKFSFSNAGWLSADDARVISDRRVWSLLFYLTSPAAVKIFIGATMIFALGMIVGFYSRICTALTFVGFVSLHNRNWHIMYGGDSVLRVLLFYLVLAPVGVCWSIDAWRKPKIYATANPGATPAVAPANGQSAEYWPLLLLQIQVCCIYVCAGVGKMYDTHWIDGSALHLILQDPSYRRWILDPVLERQAIQCFLRYASWLVCAWEISFPLLLFLHRWTRWGALAIGLLVHLGIIAFMQIHWFGHIMLCSYLALLPNRCFALDRKKEKM